MGESRKEAVLEMATTLEKATEGLMGVLGAIIERGGAQMREAERHLVRLRFSLTRVRELKQRVALDRGVFEPARLQVALSILETHAVRAEYFCDLALGQPPKAARGAAIRVAVPADGVVDTTADSEQRAA